MIANNPDATILAVTPMKETKFVSTYDENFTLNKNNAGHTQLEYVEAIKNIANLYSIPILDLYEQAPFTPIVEEQRQLYIPDGLHPSIIGYKKLSYVISGKLFSL